MVRQGDGACCAGLLAATAPTMGAAASGDGLTGQAGGSTRGQQTSAALNTA